jgi:hypothetical protein
MIDLTPSTSDSYIVDANSSSATVTIYDNDLPTVPPNYSSENLGLDHAAYTVEQVKLMMSVNGSDPVDITDTSAPPVIVGQMIKLSVEATPDPGNLAWLAPDLPGQVVQDYTQRVNGTTLVPYSAGGEYNNAPVSFAWIAALNDGPVTMSTRSDLWNCHDVSGSVDVLSPSATLNSLTTILPPITVGDNGISYSDTLHFGYGVLPGLAGITYVGSVTTPSGGSGERGKRGHSTLLLIIDNCDTRPVLFLEKQNVRFWEFRGHTTKLLANSVERGSLARARGELSCVSPE